MWAPASCICQRNTVEASKPDWPKLCKYGPQNKHHGTLANCSSCNHKLQSLSSRTYPGSNTEPAENPFKTTCHIFRCVNSWLALGARERKAEPFQNTWTGELQQRPHTQWLPWPTNRNLLKVHFGSQESRPVWRVENWLPKSLQTWFVKQNPKPVPTQRMPFPPNLKLWSRSSTSSLSSSPFQTRKTSLTVP